MRPITNVLIESIIIGLMNAFLLFGIIQLDLKIPTLLIYFIGGALIHIIFEYTGGNQWWCEQTYP